MSKIDELRELIRVSRKTVVFTGAGISVPSGIPDFRSADGLYNDKGYTVPPEEIISHSFFVKKPELFFEFYKTKMLYPNAKPNEAHKFFASLEKDGKDVTVITQNIDGLHQAAGSSKVIELHGSVKRNHCMECGKFFDGDFVASADGIPRCDCGGIVKPDVVLYEESLIEEDINAAIKAIRGADTLIVVGTSLVVYPAAGFISYYRGSNLVLINKSKTQYDSMAKLVFNMDVVEVVKSLK